MMTQPYRSRGGLVLIELFIIVSIIALLVSILLPARRLFHERVEMVDYRLIELRKHAHVIRASVFERRR